VDLRPKQAGAALEAAETFARTMRSMSCAESLGHACGGPARGEVSAGPPGNQPASSVGRRVRAAQRGDVLLPVPTAFRSSAVALVREAMPVFQGPGAAGHRGNALNVSSAAQCGLGDAESALVSAVEAVELATSHHNRVWEGHWLSTLGRAQQACGQVDEALASYRRSAALHHGLGDRSREASAWDRTGVGYQALGRYREAIDFHLTAAAVYRELDDGRRVAVVLAHLADARSRSGEHDASEATRHEAVRILARYDDAQASRLRSRLERIVGD
jgi:tetratricopeptide (TPR) repeat protein